MLICNIHVIFVLQDAYQLEVRSQSSLGTELRRLISGGSNVIFYSVSMLSLAFFSALLASKPHPVHSRLAIGFGGAVSAGISGTTP